MFKYRIFITWKSVLECVIAVIVQIILETLQSIIAVIVSVLIVFFIGGLCVEMVGAADRGSVRKLVQEAVPEFGHTRID